jgi:rhodanese-related sulfurtransferase
LQCQTSPSVTGLVKNPAFDKEIKTMLSFSVPVISVHDAQKRKDVLFLDAREADEYQVSHIPSAVCIGYDHWDKSVVQSIPKDQAIIIYCSIGYRSEKIGNKLKALGYTNVQNLYGSIFEWANAGFPLEQHSTKTNKLHTYNKKWSKWVENKNVEKVY